MENQIKLSEDPTHFLAHDIADDPEEGAGDSLSVWVRCDGATGTCERAPLPSGVDTVNP